MTGISHWMLSKKFYKNSKIQKQPEKLYLNVQKGCLYIMNLFDTIIPVMLYFELWILKLNKKLFSFYFKYLQVWLLFFSAQHYFFQNKTKINWQGMGNKKTWITHFKNRTVPLVGRTRHVRNHWFKGLMEKPYCDYLS